MCPVPQTPHPSQATPHPVSRTPGPGHRSCSFVVPSVDPLPPSSPLYAPYYHSIRGSAVNRSGHLTETHQAKRRGGSVKWPHHQPTTPPQEPQNRTITPKPPRGTCHKPVVKSDAARDSFHDTISDRPRRAEITGLLGQVARCVQVPPSQRRVRARPRRRRLRRVGRTTAWPAAGRQRPPR